MTRVHPRTDHLPSTGNSCVRISPTITPMATGIHPKAATQAAIIEPRMIPMSISNQSIDMAFYLSFLATSEIVTEGILIRKDFLTRRFIFK